MQVQCLHTYIIPRSQWVMRICSWLDWVHGSTGDAMGVDADLSSVLAMSVFAAACGVLLANWMSLGRCSGSLQSQQARGGEDCFVNLDGRTNRRCCCCNTRDVFDSTILWLCANIEDYDTSIQDQENTLPSTLAITEHSTLSIS